MNPDDSRSKAEAFLVRKTGQTAIEAAALSDEQLAEHVLAVNGLVVVSAQIASEIERLRRGASL